MSVLRKHVGSILTTGVLVMSGVAPVIAAETVRFAFGAPSAVTLGESFPLELSVDPAGQGISELPFIIGYDPAVLEVLSVEPGPFLGRGGDFRPEVDREEGRIRVDAARSDGATSPAPGVLAKVTFKVAQRFTSTSIDGMTMAPVSLYGEGLPPEYPPTLHLRYRAAGGKR
ncbi:MAG: cohesin domain-containing protein [Aromatoleum sp.]|uniref:cohesin domain-containing protein n=1 Tax=Aromatoleum sp. TaxID=2307007 RepID=UPI002893944E|nr:cohesin domain-containing protein [Aromatoleum sp.]MDT3670682.1 cohesin domain-containing protein [Aromatoleum sp.]